MNTASTTAAASIASPSHVNADGEIEGLIYVSSGNVYANINGALFSGPINLDGSFSRRFDGAWCEVEDFEEAADEMHAAQIARGITKG